MWLTLNQWIGVFMFYAVLFCAVGGIFIAKFANDTSVEKTLWDVLKPSTFIVTPICILSILLNYAVYFLLHP